jgi:hypothetical protein
MKLKKTRMNNREIYALDYLKCETFEDFTKLNPIEVSLVHNIGELTKSSIVYSVTLEVLGDKWFKILAREILERAKDMY